MNKERVIRRLEEIAKANFCRLFLTSDCNSSIIPFIFGANFTGKTYPMKLDLNKIDVSWSAVVERELAYLMEKDRVKAAKEYINSIYGTMGLGKPTYVSHKLPKIKKVIFNDPATIILWNDGTKTVVKAEGEGFDHEKGMAMAIAKKALGNQGKYYNEFKKWLPEEKEEELSPLTELKNRLANLSITIPKLEFDFSKLNNFDDRPSCCIDHGVYGGSCDTCEFGPDKE